MKRWGTKRWPRRGFQMRDKTSNRSLMTHNVGMAWIVRSAPLSQSYE